MSTFVLPRLQTPQLREFGFKMLTFLFTAAIALTFAAVGQFRRAGIMAVVGGLVIVIRLTQHPLRDFAIGFFLGAVTGISIALLFSVFENAVLVIVSQATEVEWSAIPSQLVIEFVMTWALLFGCVHTHRKNPNMI